MSHKKAQEAQVVLFYRNDQFHCFVTVQPNATKMGAMSRRAGTVKHAIVSKGGGTPSAFLKVFSRDPMLRPDGTKHGTPR